MAKGIDRTDYSFLLTLRRRDEKRYDYAYSLLKRILDDQNLLKKPINFCIVDWNIEKKDWNEDVPYYFTTQESLSKWLVISSLSQKRASNFVFETLPLRVLVDLRKKKFCKDRSIRITYDKKGFLPYKLTLTFQLLEDDITFGRNYLSSYLNVGQSLWASNSECFKNGKIFNRKELIKNVPELEISREDFNSINTRLSRLGKFFAREYRKFKYALEDSFGLEYFEKSFDRNAVSFLKLIYLYFLFPDDSRGVVYIPGKGFLQNERSESTCGGFHYEYKYANVTGSEFRLFSYATLFSIRHAVEDVSREILRHGTKSAISAIISRNHSHHIGSHVMPRSTTEKIYRKLTDLGFIKE